MIHPNLDIPPRFLSPLPSFLQAFLLASLLSTSLSWAQPNNTTNGKTALAAIKLVLGAERPNVYLPALHGQRVGLLINATSKIGSTRVLDQLIQEKVDVRKIFCPEHGCAGTYDAGANISNGIDDATGLPIISLYGDKKKPSPDDLVDIDVIVFDMQDVGVRFYTYASTLQYAMEACAQQGKQMIVFDRPNPNGDYIDGPILDPAYTSFVGRVPIPLVHGLTLGELASMINGEGWLADGLKVDLTLVKMLHYTHHTPYAPPIPPSPNLPRLNAIQWYPSLGLFEGTPISVGRGTEYPFELVGHPSFSPQYSFSFTPKSRPGQALHPPYENKTCYGLDLRNVRPKKKLSLQPLIDFFRAYPEKNLFFTPFFDKLAGSPKLQQQIREGMTEEQIRASWQPELMAFKKQRARYLLYPD